MVDENNAPLIGGSSYDKSHQIGAFTDKDGRYTLKVPLSCKALEFHADGFYDRSVPLTKSDTLNVLMMSGYIAAPKYEYRVAGKQATRVTGTIKRKTGKVIRPRVRIERTETVVFADKKGNYALTVPPPYDILSFESDNCPAQKAINLMLFLINSSLT